MANQTLKSLLAKKNAEIEEAEKSAIDKQPDAHEDADNQPEDMNTDEMLNQEEALDEPDDEQGSYEDVDDESGDYRDRFNRLKGKMSGMEREKNAALERAKTLEAQLQALQSDQAEQDIRPNQDELKQAAEKRLAQELGEDWEYLDDATKKAMLRLEMSNAAKDPRAEIEKVLNDKEALLKRDAFLSKMDGIIKSQTGQGFIALANSEAFAKWLNEDRKRGLVFADAAKHQDEQAEKDLLDLVAQYNARAKPAKQKKAPVIRNQISADKSKSTSKISFEQYEQAVRDKAFPAKRKKANAIIAAYHKQEKENG